MPLQSIVIKTNETYFEPKSRVILALKRIGNQYVYLRIQPPKRIPENRYLDLGDSYALNGLTAINGFYVQAIDPLNQSVKIQFFCLKQ